MKKILLLIPLLLGVCFIFAQASEYSFVQSSETYTEITGGTVVVTGDYDDVQYAITPPFAFTYNAIPVTEMAMSTNGYLSFNAGTSSFGYTAISSSTTGAGVIAAMSRDLRGRVDGEMRWEVFGTAPDRYAVYQWKNWTAYGSSYVDDNWNFQVILYEGSNDIAIRYGTFSFTSTYSNTAQVGLRGSTNADFNNRATTADWSATTAGELNNATCAISSTIYPPAGLQFRYNYPSATTPPNPAIAVNPLNGASNVLPTATLNWASGGGFPTGYKLSFGTNNPPTNILLESDLGDVTTYDPTPDMAYNTTYYWQVIPYNANGSAAGCPVWSFTTHPEGLVVIGDGTDVTPMLPINAYYGYSYSQVLYLQSEIGNPGVITSIAYYWNGAAESTASNDWTVYMGHTSLNFFTANTDWVPLANLTQVFSGEVALPAVAGWITIPLSPTFVYNGTDNLVIGVDENEPDYDYPYGQFHCTASTGVRGLLYYNDYTNPDPAAPPAAGYMLSSFANLMLNIDDLVAAPPAVPTLTYPANAAAGLPAGGFDLTWSPGFPGGLPDYYAVYMSMTEANIYSDHYWETFDTHFNPVTDGGLTFNYDERWYWTVEAINDLGSAVVDPPHWFEIESDPTITVFPHLQDYETWPPLNWDLTGGTHSFAQYPDGTGNNWAYANFWGQSEGSTDIMTSPPILSTTDLKLNFTWSHQYSASYPSDALTLQISADGTTWTDLWYKAGADLDSADGAAATTPGTGVTETLTIPPTYTGSVFWLRFFGYSGYGPDLFIDDFYLAEPLDHDVKPVSIGGIPGEVVAPMPITPTAVVSNLGLNAESFNVSISWDTYTDTQSVSNLGVGETATVTFATFTPTANVADLLTVTTLLGTDMDTSNDQISQSMLCLDLDKQVYADVAYSNGGTTGPATFNLMTPGTITDLPALNPWEGDFLAGADWINAGWHGAQYDSGSLTTDNYWQVDTATGAGTDLGNVGAGLTGIAHDANNGILYGVGYDTVDKLYTLDPATGLATLVGTITGNTGGLIISIAYDNATNVLYAVDLGLDALFTIDPVTLVATMVGYLGVDLNYAQDCAFDQDDGQLYLAGYSGTGALYWINTTSGGAYKIGDFQGGWEMAGFAIPYGMALDVPDVTIGSDGTLSWTAIDGASSYNIYSSTDPYGTFTFEASTNLTTWPDPNFPQARKFYQVTASTDAVARTRRPISGLDNLPPKTRVSNSSPDSGIYNAGKRALK